MWSPDDVILIANSVSSQHVAAVARNLQRLVHTVLVIRQSFLLMTGRSIVTVFLSADVNTIVGFSADVKLLSLT